MLYSQFRAAQSHALQIVDAIEYTCMLFCTMDANISVNSVYGIYKYIQTSSMYDYMYNRSERDKHNSLIHYIKYTKDLEIF